MKKKQIVHYGVSSLLLLTVVWAITLSLIAFDVLTPYIHILGSILFIFFAYSCAYKRYKYNTQFAGVSFVRQAIIDPTVIVLSIPFSFLFVSPGICDYAAFLFAAFSYIPYMLTTKKIAGDPEKRWKDLNTISLKILYIIGYLIIALFAFIAIISLINRIKMLATGRQFI